MVEVNCLEDLPIRVLDLLKIFLAASSRGEMAVLVLETRSKAVTTKYRSVDIVVGTPAHPTSTSTRRRTNPARARRSQLRLEEFKRKKLEEKAKEEHQNTLDSQAAGVSSSTTNRLVLELAKKEDRPVGNGLTSPILQVDGGIEEDIAVYSFESNYHEDDIMDTLGEIFPASEVNLTLDSTVQVAPRSARYLFVITLTVKPTATGRKLSWPDMQEDQAVVFEKVKRIYK
jgi:hypothetical protein